MRGSLCLWLTTYVAFMGSLFLELAMSGSIPVNAGLM
jgi:hypothetical protein